MFTLREFTSYLLYLQPKLTWKEAEEKAQKFERWVGKYRKDTAPPLFTLPSEKPKKNKSLKWLGVSVEDLKKREDTQGHS